MDKLQNKNTSNGVKRAILIIASLSLFFAIAFSIRAATIIEDYPNLPACENNAQCHPGQTGFGFPQFIKYIYLFALGIVGIVGLLAIIIAAFDYVTSAGNPQKASGAKDKIISALLGLLLLLGSVVLLNLINPDLLKLKLEAPEVKISTDIDKCKKECAAAGPPSPACLQKCEGIETGCRIITASWDKRTIDAEESAKLTFTLSKECAGLPAIQWKTGDLNLMQEYPKFTDEYSNKLCKKAPAQPPGLTSYDYWICTFPQRHFKAFEEYIRNYYKNAPEQFYLEGSLKLNDVKQYLADKLPLTVRDLKDDGTCCN